MKQFTFGSGKSIIKILYDNAIRGKKIYYKGTAYVLTSSEEEIAENKRIFEFSFKRHFLSWDKISDFIIEPKDEYERVLNNVVHLMKLNIVDRIQDFEAKTTKEN